MPPRSGCKTKESVCGSDLEVVRVSSIIILACLFAVSSFYCSLFFSFAEVTLTFHITSGKDALLL